MKYKPWAKQSVRGKDKLEDDEKMMSRVASRTTRPCGVRRDEFQKKWVDRRTGWVAGTNQKNTQLTKLFLTN